MQFADRADAGRRLAERLAGLADEDVIVLALPRGGVPVAWEVASRLHAPLDVFLVRKLGVPGHEELAMGALASGGVRVLNPDVVSSLGIAEKDIEAVARTEAVELERRAREYRGDRAAPRVRGRVAVLVDDGLATGASMRAGVAALRAMEPKRIVVAVPVGAAETCDALRRQADEVVCLASPEPFWAVGRWYRDFRQTTDEEVKQLLARAPAEPAVEGGRRG